MYEIYETKGYILSSIPSGEADRILNIFTEGVGLVQAKAQGIRYEKSKLRFATQDFSYLNVSLIRGKGYWRVVSASPISNLYVDMHHSKNFEVVVRIFSLLDRLLQGEELNLELYQIVDNAINYLKNLEIERDSLIDVECVIVLRILNNLGYVGDTKSLNFFTLETHFDDRIAGEMKLERTNALREINRALKESHL